MNIAVYFIQFLEVVLLVGGAMYLFDDWRLGVAAVPSSSAAVRKVAEILPSLAGDNVIDLGSGWGGMSIAAARACPDKKVVGIEYALMPYLWSRLRRALNPSLKNLTFLRMDFFKYALTGTPIVFCYMPPEFMPRLDPLLRALPPGAAIISNSEEIKGMTPSRIVPVPGLLPEKLLVYQVA